MQNTDLKLLFLYIKFQISKYICILGILPVLCLCEVTGSNFAPLHTGVNTGKFHCSRNHDLVHPASVICSKMVL